MSENRFDAYKYQLLYYYKILLNVCHPHRVKLPEDKVVIKKNFFIDNELLDTWQKFFRCDGYADIPLIYFMKKSDTSLGMFDLLSEYDLSLAKLLHVKSSLWLSERRPLFVEGHYYTKTFVCDVIKINEDRICLIACTKVFNANDIHIMSFKNAFLFTNLTSKEANLFHGLPNHPKHKKDLFIGLSKLESQFKTKVARHEIYIPRGMGSEYGLLSGDLNPIHTNKYLARLVGAKNAFIQGMCTFNMLISKLSMIIPETIGKVNITFCQKIYENQSIYLLLDKNRYELVDKENTLLAFGRVKKS